MPVSRHDLERYCTEFLNVDDFKDYAPNGLQVEGKKDIKRIVTGVTACNELIEKAISLKADALLVHHGYFWKGESQVITGMKAQRIKNLLTNDINLFGYHLPLDYHKNLGNNVKLAEMLEIDISGEVFTDSQPNLALAGSLKEPQSLEEFSNFVENKLARKPLFIQGSDKPVKQVVWCTGAAQDFIEDAAKTGADTYISGEVSERTTHIARELGIHYFACGHHATERYGIQALGEHLASEFGLEHKFVDVENPV